MIETEAGQRRFPREHYQWMVARRKRRRRPCDYCRRNIRMLKGQRYCCDSHRALDSKRRRREAAKVTPHAT